MKQNFLDLNKPFSVAMAFFILSAVALLLYNLSLHSFFVADDHLWRGKDSLPQLWSYFYSSWGHGVAYRPLVRVSFWLNTLISSSDPFSWHVFNVLIHSVNATLIFCIARRVCNLSSLASLSSFDKFICALSIALLFLTSRSVFMNVSWISARTHSLGALFFLLAFYCLLTNQRFKYSYSCVFFIASMMCYESMAIFPFFLLSLFVLKLYCESGAISFKSILYYKTECYALLFYLLVLVLFLLIRGEFLDLYTVEVSPLITETKSFFNNIYFWPDYILGYFKWLRLVLLVLFASFFFVNGKLTFFNMRRVVAFVLLLLSGLIIVSPYLLAAGFGYRYTYLIAGFVCVAFPLFIFTVAKNNRKFFTAILVYFLLTSVYEFQKTSKRVLGFSQASDLAYEILKESKNTIGHLPEKKELFFIGVPSYTKSFVYVTYFDLALKSYFKQENNSSLIVWDSLLFTLPILIKNVDENDLFYIYRDNRIIQVSMAEWLSSPELKKLNITSEP